MASLLSSVVHHVTEIEGEPPAGTCVTFPANWGAYRRELLAQVLLLAGIPLACTLTEPEAAASYYASARRIPPESKIAVYDLGGGTFDATVLKHDERGVEILGTPQGLEHLGGMDFDEAVFTFVRHHLDGMLDQLDSENANDRDDIIRLRQECVQAKEALSTETSVTVPVALRGTRTQVRLTRGELESMLTAPLQLTVEALQRAVTGAGVEPVNLATVLLAGGSSRIPLAGRLISAALGCETAVDAHPKHITAMGAAIAAAAAHQPATSRQTTVTTALSPDKNIPSETRPVESRPPPSLGGEARTRTFRKATLVILSVIISLAAIGSTVRALSHVRHQIPVSATTRPQHRHPSHHKKATSGDTPALRPVPNVIGMNLTAAQYSLQNKGFHSRLSYEKNGRVTPNTVLSQSPASPHLAILGSTIYLIISATRAPTATRTPPPNRSAPPTPPPTPIPTPPPTPIPTPSPT